MLYFIYIHTVHVSLHWYTQYVYTDRHKLTAVSLLQNLNQYIYFVQSQSYSSTTVLSHRTSALQCTVQCTLHISVLNNMEICPNINIEPQSSSNALIIQYMFMEVLFTKHNTGGASNRRKRMDTQSRQNSIQNTSYSSSMEGNPSSEFVKMGIVHLCWNQCQVWCMFVGVYVWFVCVWSCTFSWFWCRLHFHLYELTHEHMKFLKTNSYTNTCGTVAHNAEPLLTSIQCLSCPLLGFFILGKAFMIYTGLNTGMASQ